MLRLRPSDERGLTQTRWLTSKHSFSFASYHDAAHMNFSYLRVINEDWIAPSKGFAPHGHENMEILTYMLSGVLNHKDSEGHEGAIHAGEAQYMSAGSGITHSEYNGSGDTEAHLLQIWVIPSEMNTPPAYDQKQFKTEDKLGKFCKIAGPENDPDILTWKQDASLYATMLNQNEQIVRPITSGRMGYVQLASGNISIGPTNLQAGDGIAIHGQLDIQITATQNSEFLFFDLPQIL